MALSLICATPLGAQLTRDWQFHGVAVVLADRFVGGGIGLALRPPGRLRFAAIASIGDQDRSVAGRGEVLLAFHLNPGRESGVAPYGAAGVAAQLTRSVTRGYLEVLVGVEHRPGRRSGLFVEAGVGGGMRIAAGYRMRAGSGIRR